MRVACLTIIPFAAFALLGGCSDPVPPTPQGAFQVNFADSGATCNIASHRTEVGVVDSTKKTTVVVDGVEGADVQCKVSGAGPFTVSARVVLGADLLNISIPAINAGSTVDNPAKGGAAFTSFKTGGAYGSQADGCDFYFKDGTGEGVAAGKLWVSFKCAEVIGDYTCAIAESHVILENCDQ